MTLKRCSLFLVAAVATASTVQAAAVTSPKQLFGFNLGDDYCLANYKQLTAYWAKLERDTTIHELQIGLKVPLSGALVTDWRKQPFYRSLMRLPWSMTPANVIRVRLGTFNQPADEIHRTLLRMWRYFRS